MLKSQLINNEEFKLIFFKAPRGQTDPKQLYYETVGIDIAHGPTFSDGQWQVHVAYHGHPHVYSEPVADVMSVKNQNFYDYIWYNHTKWDKQFSEWLRNESYPIHLRLAVGDLIYADGRFLDVSWLPPISTRFAMRGTEQLVSVCGGRQVSTQQLVSANFELIHANNTMFYVSHTEPVEIVASSGLSGIERLRAFTMYQKQIMAQQVLYHRTKRVQRRLKPAKANERFSLICSLPRSAWEDWLFPRVQRYQIPKLSRGKYRISHAESHCLFNKELFMNANTNHFVSNMYMCVTLSPTLCRLSFKGYILEFDTNSQMDTFSNLIGRFVTRSACLPNDFEAFAQTDGEVDNMDLVKGEIHDFAISVYSLEPRLRKYIVDFLSPRDLLHCKAVCSWLHKLCTTQMM